MRPLALLAVLVATMATAQRQGQDLRATQGQGIKKGMKAQTFKLDLLEQGKEFDLAKHIGEKPVVLVFGSYT